MLSIDLAAGRRPLLSSTDTATGALIWSEAPAISIAEKSVGIHRQPIGGVLLVVEGRDGVGSALVRGGPSAAGTPWRYRSPGRLGHEIVQDAAGRLQIVEVRADGFPEFVAFDGRTGTILSRTAFAPGFDGVLNVRCVPAANAIRLVPARVGHTEDLRAGHRAVRGGRNRRFAGLRRVWPGIRTSSPHGQRGDGHARQTRGSTRSAGSSHPRALPFRKSPCFPSPVTASAGSSPPGPCRSTARGPSRGWRTLPLRASWRSSRCRRSAKSSHGKTWPR